MSGSEGLFWLFCYLLFPVILFVSFLKFITNDGGGRGLLLVIGMFGVFMLRVTH